MIRALVVIYIKLDELCIYNDEFCVKHDEFVFQFIKDDD